MSAGMTVEFDPASLADLGRRAKAAATADVLTTAAIDLARVGEAAAQEATPQVTGNARRSTVSVVDRQPTLVVGRYPYLRWLDTGTDGRGRKMRTRDGGYRIKARAMAAAKAAAPGVLDKCGREVAARWSD